MLQIYSDDPYEYGGDPSVLEAAKRLGRFVLDEYLVPGAVPKDLQTPCVDLVFRSLLLLYQYSGDPDIVSRLDAYYGTRLNVGLSGRY